MDNLSYHDILSEIAQVRGLLPGDQTNVVSVSFSYGELYFETEDAELQDELDDANSERDSLQEELDDLNKEADDFLARAEAAEEICKSIKDGEYSILDYKEDKEKAEAAADTSREIVRQWQAKHNVMERELTSLRKRKGVGPGIYKHLAEIMTVVRSAAKTDKLAQDILTKITCQ